MVVALLAATAVSACGSEPGGGSDPGACTTNADCPGGTCDDGQCVAFRPQEDVIPADTAAPVDVKALPDGETQGPDDLKGGPDGQEPPAPDAEETEPEDTGGPKPSGGDPDILVDPMSHVFTYLPGVYNPETKAVLIYNQGKGDLEITKIAWSQGSSAEYTFMALPPLPKKLPMYGQTSVTVVFQEQQPHGNATLEIHSNDPDSPVVLASFSSQSKTGDTACIQLMPSLLNFGKVVRGTSKTMSFDIVNCSSTVPLTVSKITRSKGFFGMELSDEYQFDPPVPLPLALAPGQKSTQNVTYAPGLAGVDQGYFELWNTDPAKPKAKLDVYAEGIPPPLEELGLHIVLDWNTDCTDVDLHLLRPGGTLFDCVSDCYFANMSPDWGVQGDYIDDPFLDYDDVDGFGPENLNVSAPVPGKYEVIIHYYADSHEGCGGWPSDATVKIYSFGQLLVSFGPQNLQSTGVTWDVATIDWPSQAVTYNGDMGTADQGGMCLDWPW
jgi:hypothetical protein